MPPRVRARRRAPTRAPVARRDFLRRGLLASVAVFAAEFGGASLAFLWPNLKGQFGSVITAGSLSDIKAYIEQNNQPFYLGAGRFYIVPYNGDGTDTIYAGLVDQNLMALYQRCVHLGLPRAVLPAEPVVRVPMPRIEVQRGRRVPAGSGADRVCSASP